VDFYDYLILQKERFKNRTTRWKVSDDDKKNEMVDEEFHNIDSWCFSSQYYFTNTLYISGQVVMIMGLQTIIIQNFNFFSDSALPIIVLFVSIFCVILE
jgi:hypothetical protein